MNDAPIKMCGVYFIDDSSVLIEGTDYEPSGPGGLSSSVQVKLSREATDPMLGSVVLMVLEQTRIVKGADWNAKSVMATTSLMTGIKSNRSLVSKAKYLEISLKDATVRVMPTQRERHGNGSGWLHLPDYEECCAPAPDLVHDLILQKLKQCC